MLVADCTSGVRGTLIKACCGSEGTWRGVLSGPVADLPRTDSDWLSRVWSVVAFCRPWSVPCGPNGDQNYSLT
jgi:hypothetical protein